MGEEPTVAVQTRCPTCLGEQWALTVLAFSYGKVPCGWCGVRTKVMTDAQWRAALRRWR